MFDLLRHPLGFIKNKVKYSENSFSLVHSDRHLFLGILMVILVVTYILKFIDSLRIICSSQPGDSSILSLVLSLLSFIVFSGVFLRYMIFSKKIAIENGSLYLFNYWPFRTSKASVKLSEIENITITTLFSHLSRKSTVFVSIRILGKRNLKQVYSCLGKDLNELVIQIAKSLEDNEIDVIVNNENTLPT